MLKIQIHFGNRDKVVFEDTDKNMDILSKQMRVYR